VTCRPNRSAIDQRRKVGQGLDRGAVAQTLTQLAIVAGVTVVVMLVVTRTRR